MKKRKRKRCNATKIRHQVHASFIREKRENVIIHRHGPYGKINKTLIHPYEK